MENVFKYQFYIDVVSITGNTTDSSFVSGNTSNDGVGRKFGIYSKKDNVVKNQNDNDFFVNLPLYKKNTIEEYVDEKRQNNVEFINDTRQQFNPLYIEHSFFDSVKSNKLISSASFPLNEMQTEYIKTVRPDIKNMGIYTNEDVNKWFVDHGQYELPWITSAETVNLDNITTLDPGSLSLLQIENIRTVRPDVDLTYDTEYKILMWFAQTGKDEFPWVDGTTLDSLTKIGSRNDMIISKASKFPIDINN